MPYTAMGCFDKNSQRKTDDVFCPINCSRLGVDRDLTIAQVASDTIIDRAYAWLCDQRQDYHPNNDVWQVRRWWDEKKPLLQAQLLAGTYRLREQRLIRGAEGRVELWSAMDALVLKALALVLGEHLRPHLSDRVFHLAGSGGMKAGVREVAAHLNEHEFVFRTDVKGYYASINHGILYRQVAAYVDDRKVLDLVGQYLARFVSDGGDYVDITQGISLGCPLSPLMGALYLKPLDDRMAAMGCFYARFMDDWVVLAPTRWQLRRAIKAVNEEMAKLLVVQHPDKTFIGRIARGFDFLGYWFAPDGLSIAGKSVERMLEKVSRLYEQGADNVHIETYLKRWLRWVRSSVETVKMFGKCVVSLSSHRNI